MDNIDVYIDLQINTEFRNYLGKREELFKLKKNENGRKERENDNEKLAEVKLEYIKMILEHTEPKKVGVLNQNQPQKEPEPKISHLTIELLEPTVEIILNSENIDSVNVGIQMINRIIDQHSKGINGYIKKINEEIKKSENMYVLGKNGLEKPDDKDIKIPSATAKMVGMLLETAKLRKSALNIIYTMINQGLVIPGEILFPVVEPHILNASMSELQAHVNTIKEIAEHTKFDALKNIFSLLENKYDELIKANGENYNLNQITKVSDMLDEIEHQIEIKEVEAEGQERENRNALIELTHQGIKEFRGRKEEDMSNNMPKKTISKEEQIDIISNLDINIIRAIYTQMTSLGQTEFDENMVNDDNKLRELFTLLIKNDVVGIGRNISTQTTPDKPERTQEAISRMERKTSENKPKKLGLFSRIFGGRKMKRKSTA